jgi:hypothetical protein
VGDEFEHYCTELCDPTTGSPCPDPWYRCYDDPDIGDDDVCKRNYTPCNREADCGSGESCTVQLADSGTDLVTECRPELGTGTLSTTCTTDTDCTNDLCHRATFCTEICATSADCGSGFECIVSGYSKSGVTGAVNICMYACGDDTDCVVGTLTACQPGATPTTSGGYTGEGYCSTLSSGTDVRATGGDCDHSASPPITCDHRICNDGGTGVCTEVCDDDGDCGITDWTCVDSTVTFGGSIGSVPMRVCDPP